MCIVILDGNLLFTHGAPKLDSQLGHVLVGGLHAQDGQAEQGLHHVEAHVVVVQSHDPVQTAIGALLDARVIRLGGLADDLHDVVPLALMLEVVTDELERVAQRGDGGQAHVYARLLLPGSLHHGRQDGVGVANQARTELLVLALADEADCSQRRLLLVGVALADVPDQVPHQIRPLVARQLDTGNGGDDLASGLTGLRAARGERLEGQVLDACLGLLVRLLEPFCLQRRLTGVLPSTECVLESETGRCSDVALSVLICQLLHEGCQV